MHIGEAIREIRREKSISQEKLAYDAGLSRKYIYMVEKGINSPTYETLEKIALVLGVRVSEIVILVESM